MKIKNLSVLILFIICSTGLSAQLIKYERIKDLSLCIEDTVIISIKNNKEQVLDLSNVKLRLPCELKLISLLSEGELLFSSNGIYQFKLKNLSPNETLKLTFNLLGSCENKTCIDNGELFRYTLEINGSAFSSPLFNIDVAGLNIISISPDTILDKAGMVNERVVIIKNTRPGKLAKFTLIDSIFTPPPLPAPDVQHNYSLGSFVKSGEKYFVDFGKSDFNQVGNKDDFFDFNEEIKLNVEIKVINCASGYAKTMTFVNWGCGDDVCQIRGDTTYAFYSKDVFRENQLLGVKWIEQNPACYYNTEEQQQLLVYNTSMCTWATDIDVFIIDTITAEGIVEGSLNCNKPIEEYEVIDVFTTACGTKVNKIIRIRIKELYINDTIKVNWTSSYCTSPSKYAPQWEYIVAYERGCLRESMGRVTKYGILPKIEMFPAELFYDKATIFLDKKVDTFNYVIRTDRFKYLDNKVRFTFTLPCNIEFVPSLFLNHARLPSYVSINNANDINTLILEYDLPFINHNVNIPIPVKVNCEKGCSIQDSCGTVIVTSCSNLCTSDYIEQYLNVKMEIFDSTINCPNGFPIAYFSEALKTNCFGFACPDTLAAYLDHNFSFNRSNFGYADNNNDNVPEPIQVINLSKVKLQAVVVGDTISWKQSGKIVVDKPNAMLEYFNIQLDAGFNEYLGNNYLQADSIYKDFMFKGGLDFSNMEVLLKDSKNGKYYDLGKADFKVNQDLRNILFSFSLQALKANNILPQDYAYKTNDSIILNAHVIVKKNIPSIWDNFTDRINNYSKMKVDLKFKTFFSESKVDAIDDIYICQCNEVVLEICSYYAHIQEDLSFTSRDAFYCKGQEVEIGYIGTYFGVRPGVFTNEVRSFYPLKNIAVKTDGILSVDRMALLIYCDNRLVFNNPNAVFVPQGEYAVYELPESVIIGENTDTRMLFTLKLNQDIDRPNLVDRVKFVHNYKADVFPPYFTPNEAILVNANPFEVPDLVVVEKQLNIYDKRANYRIRIRSQPGYGASSTNTFMYIDEGLSPDIIINKITFAKTGEEFQKINGLYQLGNVKIGAEFDLLFDITSTSCKDEILTINLGWSCYRINDISEKPSGEVRRQNVLLKYFPGVIDMAYADKNFKADLCANFDTISFTIVNGELGSIHDMKYRMELPRGMSFVEGTFTFKHPYNGQVIPFPDPTAIGVNQYSYTFDEVIDKFVVDGLKGVFNVNEHLFEISFIAKTDCDFISGTKIIHRTEARQKCGILSNKRSKVSPYFLIAGLDTLETVEVIPEKDIVFDNCSNTASLQLVLERKAFTEGRPWNLFFKLPTGIALINEQINLDGQPLPLTFDGIYYSVGLDASKSQINATIQLSTSLTECEDLFVIAFTTITRNALCITTNNTCNIQQVTGDAYILARIRKPQYQIENAQIIDVKSGQLNVQVSIENTGITNNNRIKLKLILDANNNFKPDAGEFEVLDTFFVDGGLLKFSTDLLANIGMLKQYQLCQLMVVVTDEDDCLCSGDYLLINGAIKVNYDEQAICWNEKAELKFDQQLSGATFVWSPLKELSCSDCLINYYDVSLDINPDSVKRFYLTDYINGRCNVEYEFTINVYPKAGILINDDAFCINEIVLLQSNKPYNNKWNINGSLVSTEKQFSLKLKDSTWVYLSNGAAGRCDASDSIYLIPYKIPSFTAGKDSTLCFRKNLSLQGIIPQSLSFRWIDVSGILSDTLIADPLIKENKSSTFVLEVCDKSCCDYDTVSYVFNNALDFNLPADTINTCLNDTILINLSQAYQYSWNDAFKDFCVDENCTSLVIPVGSLHMTGEVTAIDASNCVANDVLVISATEYLYAAAKEITICNGDSLLTLHPSILVNGEYADTLFIDNECPVIQKYKVNLKGSNTTTTSNVSICQGQTFDFEGKIVSATGQYCREYESINFCDSTICVNLTVQPNPLIVLDSVIYNAVAGSELQLEEKGSQQKYEWKSEAELSCNDCYNPIVMVVANTTVNLIVSNEFGCKDTAIIRINIVDLSCFENLSIPNAFTPNNNNRNEVFRIVNGDHYDIQTFEIYNEWGQKIFTAYDNSGWDGTIKGELAPQATYVYVITTNCNNKSETITGYVTLLR